MQSSTALALEVGRQESGIGSALSGDEPCTRAKQRALEEEQAAASLRPPARSGVHTRAGAETGSEPGQGLSAPAGNVPAESLGREPRALSCQAGRWRGARPSRQG